MGLGGGKGGGGIKISYFGGGVWGGGDIFRPFIIRKRRGFFRTSPWRPIGRVVIITFTYWYQNFTTPKTHEKKILCVCVCGGGWCIYLWNFLGV